MRYMVLKKATPGLEDPFLEMVSGGAGRGETEFPFLVESHDLQDKEVADLQLDPAIEDVVLSVPYILVEPVEVEEAETAATTSWGIEVIGAPSSPQDGKGVVVAVLDTGIERSHPAFSKLEIEEMDFTVDARGVPGSAPDDTGHGTHCAATILGREVKGTRVGVAPGVQRVLIGKVLGPPHGGSTEAVHNAIEWAVRNRADVISMSLGFNFSKVVSHLIASADLPLDIAVARALEGYRSNLRMFDRLASFISALVERGRGAVIVVAAGNQSRRNEDPRFTVATAPPAIADGFTSVGAVSQTQNPDSPFAVAPFSNTGCLLAAPGVSILSAGPAGTLSQLSGTSMAAPHVAGVAALWTQRLFPDGSRPSGWAKDVQRVLETNIVKTPYLSRNDVGLGVVQAPQ